MRIVYCINNTWYSGGMTRVLANKVNYLAALGHDVFIITTDQIGHSDHYYIAPEVKKVDLHINYLGLDQASLLKKILFLPLLMWRHRSRLKKQLKLINANIAISMFTKDVYIIPTINDKSKKILELHTSRFNWIETRKKFGFLGSLLNYIDDFVINKYDRFVIQTIEDKHNWKSINHIEVIPNANTFKVDREVSSLKNKIALAVGRYSYEKRFEDLIYAWRIVYAQHPDWELHIVGDGVERERLEHLVRSYNLEKVIKLKHTNPQIQNEYLNASMLLLSSRYEGLGMVLLEGATFGLPLVAYACQCGPRDIIENGKNGFLIEEGNIESMAEHILKLINSQELREEIGNSAKLYSERYSEDVIMKKWINLFTDLIK